MNAPYRRQQRLVMAAAALGVVVGMSGCVAQSASISEQHGGTTTTSTMLSATTAATSTSTTTTTVAAFEWSQSPVSAADLGGSWHSGCPVGPADLRALQLRYWGFDGASHVGTMVVNSAVVNAVVQVFTTLYRARFPIEQMVPMSAFGGDDNAAAAADNTSGFDCRDAVASGPPDWSVHAYGEAIDVNDVQNPYVDGNTVIPPAGAAYVNRADVRPGMAVPGGTLVDAFAAVGWPWGGRWSGTPDYQHFSATGG